MLLSGNAQFRTKAAIFSRVPYKFDGWPRKTVGHLFYVISSFMHHFIAISEFYLELLSGNAQFWLKIGDFLSRVTLKFDRWPWKTIGRIFYATSSFVHHFKAIAKLKLKLQSENAQFWSKSAFFCPVCLTDDLKKIIGHLFYVVSSFVHHFIAISEL